MNDEDFAKFKLIAGTDPSKGPMFHISSETMTDAQRAQLIEAMRRHYLPWYQRAWLAVADWFKRLFR